MHEIGQIVQTHRRNTRNRPTHAKIHEGMYQTGQMMKNNRRNQLERKKNGFDLGRIITFSMAYIEPENFIGTNRIRQP